MEADNQYSIYLRLRGDRREQLQAWFTQVLKAIKPYLKHRWLVTGAYQRLSVGLYTRAEEAGQVGDKEPFLYFSSSSRRDPALPDAYPLVLDASGSPDLKHLVRTLNAIGEHVVRRYMEWSDREKLLSFEELGITSGKEYYRSFMYTPSLSEAQRVQALPEELLSFEELGITDVIRFPVVAEQSDSPVVADDSKTSAGEGKPVPVDTDTVATQVAKEQPVKVAPPPQKKQPETQAVPKPKQVAQSAVKQAPKSEQKASPAQKPEAVPPGSGEQKQKSAPAKKAVKAESVAPQQPAKPKVTRGESSQVQAAKVAEVAVPPVSSPAPAAVPAEKTPEVAAPVADAASKLLEQLQANKKAQRRYHLSGGAFFITVPDSGVCYCSVPLTALEDLINESDKVIPEQCSLAQVQALRGSMQGFPLSHLTWSVAFAVSADIIRARLSGRKIGIKAWPDLGLPNIRQHLKLATHLMNNIADVEAVASATGVPVETVCRFYNACEVMGISRDLG